MAQKSANEHYKIEMIIHFECPCCLKRIAHVYPTGDFLLTDMNAAFEGIHIKLEKETQVCPACGVISVIIEADRVYFRRSIPELITPDWIKSKALGQTACSE